MAAAAITATIGASVGYYAAAYVSAVRWAYAGRPTKGGRRASWWPICSPLRSVAIEFGPAETDRQHR